LRRRLSAARAGPGGTEVATIPTPSDYARRARQAARSGDYSQAGDFYRLAGNWKKANKMYLRGGHFDLAARLAEEMGDFASASLYFLKAGELKAAGEMELQLGNRDKAAYLFSRGGQHYRAAELFEALDQIGAAAEQFERAGFLEKAAPLYHRHGNLLQAARLYESLIAAAGGEDPGTLGSESRRANLLKYHRSCADLFLQAGRPEQAAAHFEAALCPEEAASAWKTAGRADKAAEILLRLHKPEEAYTALREAGRDLGSLPPEVQAVILTRQGRQNEAAEVLEKAGLLYAAAEAWAQAGDDGHAAELYEADGDLEQASVHYTRNGRLADAARVLEATRDYRNAADLYRQAGRPAEAARVYLKAGEPLEAARIHYERRDPEAVIGTLQTVTRNDPDFHKASFLLGRVFLDQGLHTLAADKFTVAIDGRPVDRETVLHHYSLAIYRRILSFDFSYKDVRERVRELEALVAADPAPDGAEREAGSGAPRPRAERYRTETLLGTGHLGEVYQGTDTELGRPVAIRRVCEAPHETGKADRFLREAGATTRLTHPNILATFDTGTDADGKFIVTALAEGKTLRFLLDEKVRFEVNRIVDIGRQILEALAHAHDRRVLHRNLRPENVFLTEEDRVSVADFGLSVRLSDLGAAERASGAQIRYTPPEALLRKRVDERSDLYAFGILLYEMALGHPPFRGGAVGHQHIHDPVPLPGPGERPVPDFLIGVILRCLEKDKVDRYPSAAAVLEDLQLKEVVPGMVVSSRYEVLAEIGRGGMGAIFRARDTELDETVALKFLNGHVRPERVARLVQEIKIARQVIHPNVVRVFTLEKWLDHRFIVMEYIDGAPLTRWMERRPNPTPSDRMRVATQIVGAVDAAHRLGIIHRDIKPENILVMRGGDARVLDFGIARPEAADPSLTETGTILGSPLYVAPEQIQGKPVDRRTDIYALGAVLYLLFTGRQAFTGNSVREILLKHLHGRPQPPRELNPEIPAPVSDAILRALEPDPERRFPSAAELQRALAAVRAESIT
jgi:serine/threonine protein kinase/tetratricopeptide (TPR) repeat protein